MGTPANGRKRRSREIQSDPRLYQLWVQLRREYFPEREDLDRYTVVWSARRQKRTLAICYMQERIVRVARELDAPQHARWLPPLLYHELCHAVLGPDVARKQGKRCWHGKEFRALERRHPEIPALDRWIKEGGWRSAVLSARARAAAAKRRSARANG